MRKLKDIVKTADDNLRDDDHLDRPDITEKELAGATDELIEKHDLEKAEEKPISKFAKATIDALNKIGLIILAILFGR